MATLVRIRGSRRTSSREPASEGSEVGGQAALPGLPNLQREAGGNRDAESEDASPHALIRWVRGPGVE